MSSIETVGTYHLEYGENSQIIDPLQDFDQIAYSRMKYGNRNATETFARELAEILVEDIPQIVEDQTAPEFLVAYKAVPPACFYLSRYCLDRINEIRIEDGLSTGKIIQVHKDRVTATNYAAATPEARKRELASIGFSLGGYTITDKPVAILDDIRITGSAEKRIVDALAEERPSVLALGYVAIFNQEQAASNPSVENDLNVSSIKSIDQLLPTIEEDNFDLNIRTLKLILSEGQDELRGEFLQNIPRNLLYDLYYGAVNSGPDFVEAYQDSIDDVLAEMRRRTDSRSAVR